MAEQVALEWADELLSRRFGHRNRPYHSHESKTLSTPLLREMAAMYTDALAVSARVRVRADAASRVLNLHSLFLYVHFVVERHREALLWSWAVARMTQHAESNAGEWLDTAWLEVGGEPGSETIDVKAKKRDTIELPTLEKRLGRSDGEHAFGFFDFSSEDGFAYGSLGTRGLGRWPDMRKAELPLKPGFNGHPHFKCQIVRKRCFPTRRDLAEGYTSADFFRHIAFTNFQCGDCSAYAIVIHCRRSDIVQSSRRSSCRAARWG